MDAINEKSTTWYMAPLLDKDDALLDDVNIATMTMTLYDKKSDEIINERNSYDVRNGGAWDRGTVVDSSKTLNLEVRLDVLDNVIVNSDIDIGETEIHILLLEGTTAGSSSFAFKHQAEIKVINLNKVS